MTSKKPCNPLEHKWLYKWEGVIRKCKRCKKTHYYHYCASQWESVPNGGYWGMGIKAEADDALFDDFTDDERESAVRCLDQSNRPTLPPPNTVY